MGETKHGTHTRHSTNAFTNGRATGHKMAKKQMELSINQVLVNGGLEMNTWHSNT